MRGAASQALEKVPFQGRHTVLDQYLIFIDFDFLDVLQLDITEHRPGHKSERLQLGNDLVNLSQNSVDILKSGQVLQGLNDILYCLQGVLLAGC